MNEETDKTDRWTDRQTVTLNISQQLLLLLDEDVVFLATLGGMNEEIDRTDRRTDSQTDSHFAYIPLSSCSCFLTRLSYFLRLLS